MFGSVLACDFNARGYESAALSFSSIDAVEQQGHSKHKTGGWSMAKCPTCDHDVRTPFCFNLDGWSHVSVRSAHLDEVWVDVEDGPKWTPTEVSTWGINGHFGASSR